MLAVSRCWPYHYDEHYSDGDAHEDANNLADFAGARSYFFHLKTWSVHLFRSLGP